MEFYNGIPIIGEKDSDELYVKGFGRGAEERDYHKFPEAMYQSPDEMDVIDPADYDAYFEEQEKERSSLEHIYLGPDMKSPQFVNLDQGPDGYCWAYSPGHAIMMVRVRDHQHNPRLNPHSVGAVIKSGRDEGGWCGESQMFYKEFGCAIEGTGKGEWPLQSRNTAYHTAEERAASLLNRCDEDWVDLAKPAWSRTLVEKHLFTCLFRNQPCPIDVRAWGHSICAIRVVRVERGRFLPLIINSWRGWGRFGLALLQESMYRTIMGAVCIRTTKVAA